eukprot:TRINITY_DN13660_c0_g1_i1.p1 TRINITY_DN13660_c0_g1~~TRINITY_DN13660_c0_g1_i1.p1  ORF type:complete len:241 (-),score=44.39 TRINITY_DN13660_c0_g1_i1:159-881(-)
MALRTAMSRIAAPLSRNFSVASRSSVAGPSLRQPLLQHHLQISRSHGFVPLRPPAMWRPEARTALVGSSLQAKKLSEPKVVDGFRAMSTWRLRPYAAAGTSAASLSALSAGHSKVGLSLLVMPHKALPMALALAPTVWVLPAMYRMIFQNSMRHTTASVFTVILYLVLSFTPVPCFENLFSELTFYGIALVSTFFMYTFFPEVLLHDFMFMHYLALFTIPLIPLAFAYMPMFAARSYLFL